MGEDTQAYRQVLEELEIEVDNRVFDLLFIPEDRLTDVTFTNILIYGSQGTGKTELAKYIAHKAKEAYGEVGIFASNAVKPLLDKVRYTNNKYYVLIFEDATLRKVSQEEMTNFFRARHLLKKHSPTGHIVNIITLHDYYAIKKSMRTAYDALFLCNCPTNEYDLNAFRRLLGKEVLDKFLQLQLLKREYAEFRKLKLYWFLGNIGFCETEVVPLELKMLTKDQSLPFLTLIEKELERGKRRLGWYKEEEEDDGIEWYMDKEG